jgi:hypothetical protein
VLERVGKDEFAPRSWSGTVALPSGPPRQILAPRSGDRGDRRPVRRQENGSLRQRGTDTRPAAPPTTGPDRELYLEIAGTYTVTLSNEDSQVQENGLAGRYAMRLLPDGVMLLSVPEAFGAEGPSPSGISYRLSGNQFTTNAFVNLTCPGSVGVYRWQLDGNRLAFTPLQEECEIRRILFSSEPWRPQP